MKKSTLLVFISLFLVFLMTGCRQKSDSENAYRLPLGDAGYISEMDFKLYRKEAVKNENGETVYDFDYDYISSDTTYTVGASMIANEEKYVNKAYKMSIGYYEDGVYKALSDKAL